ncbi:hypothetical protein Nepgr_030054 [Nepenthes gracilis]|uniref:Uncharacterized protein n=1 Tax=Nepenthes gracilis TaxID=150966 RepID=A0AAD3TFH5_NEPGR|nr:hypothetical protein Nepgr_030054 [Nepenthes gracilis]
MKVITASAAIHQLDSASTAVHNTTTGQQKQQCLQGAILDAESHADLKLRGAGWVLAVDCVDVDVQLSTLLMLEWLFLYLDSGCCALAWACERRDGHAADGWLLNFQSCWRWHLLSEMHTDRLSTTEALMKQDDDPPFVALGNDDFGSAFYLVAEFLGCEVGRELSGATEYVAAKQKRPRPHSTTKRQFSSSAPSSEYVVKLNRAGTQNRLPCAKEAGKQPKTDHDFEIGS